MSSPDTQGLPIPTTARGSSSTNVYIISEQMEKELTFTEWMAKIKNVHFADQEAMDRAIASLTKPYRDA